MENLMRFYEKIMHKTQNSNHLHANYRNWAIYYLRKNFQAVFNISFTASKFAPVLSSLINN